MKHQPLHYFQNIKHLIQSKSRHIDTLNNLHKRQFQWFKHMENADGQASQKYNLPMVQW